MKLTDGEDTITNEEIEESASEQTEEGGEEENEIIENGEDGEQTVEESTESESEGLQEEEEDGVSDGSEESIEQTTTIQVSYDSISMDTDLITLGFVPVALFCIIFLLGIIALGGD